METDFSVGGELRNSMRNLKKKKKNITDIHANHDFCRMQKDGEWPRKSNKDDQNVPFLGRKSFSAKGSKIVLSPAVSRDYIHGGGGGWGKEEACFLLPRLPAHTRIGGRWGQK